MLFIIMSIIVNYTIFAMSYKLQFSIESYYHIGNGSHKYVLRLFQSGEQVEYFMFPSIGAAMEFLNLNFDLSNE